MLYPYQPSHPSQSQINTREPTSHRLPMLLIGLVLARPTGRTLFLFIATIAVVTFPVWLFLLVAMLID